MTCCDNDAGESRKFDEKGAKERKDLEPDELEGMTMTLVGTPMHVCFPALSHAQVVS